MTIWIVPINIKTVQSKSKSKRNLYVEKTNLSEMGINSWTNQFKTDPHLKRYNGEEQYGNMNQSLLTSRLYKAKVKERKRKRNLFWRNNLTKNWGKKSQRLMSGSNFG